MLRGIRASLIPPHGRIVAGGNCTPHVKKLMGGKTIFHDTREYYPDVCLLMDILYLLSDNMDI